MESKSGGIGFFGVLTIVFITLALTGNISWALLRLLVLISAPVFLSVVLALVIVIIVSLLDRQA